jgi:hypothetical protein
MNIEREDNFPIETFGSLSVNTTFLFGNDLFLKIRPVTSSDKTSFNCVNLNAATVERIGESIDVRVVEFSRVLY